MRRELRVVKRIPGSLLRRITSAVYRVFCALPPFRFVSETRMSQNPRTFKIWFMQKVLGFNRHTYWPVHFTTRVNQWQNVLVGIDSSPGYEPGCYIQGLGKIRIGNYTEVARNVGIISANHDLYDHSLHRNEETVVIGDYCWIGMGAIILPGVRLGDFTVVGAGAVVTKSFPEGYVVIGGNPAKMIRELDPAACVRYTYPYEYRGYIPAARFDEWKKWRVWL